MANNGERGPKTHPIEGEERFRVALDICGVGTWDWNVETRGVYYCDRWIESLGYQRDDVCPDMSFVDGIIHPEDKQDISGFVADHIEGQADYLEYEFRLRKKSGDYRWTLARGRVLERDSMGKAKRVLGTSSDISASKQASLTLQAEAQRSRAIVETAGCVILCLDTNFRILEWNRAAEKIYGWTHSEVRGKNYLEWFLSEEVREPVAKEIRRVLAGGVAEDYENPVIARDGTERLLRWNSKALVDDDGKAWGVVGIAQDITKQKRAERQRELAHRELEVMLERFDALRGLLRVCGVCKKIQDREGNWSSLNDYLLVSVEVEMTHGYCPECYANATPNSSS